MAREAYFIRTVEGAKVTAMVCDTTTSTVDTREFILSTKVDADKALKLVKKQYEKNGLVICKIITVEPIKQMYGMPVSKFIALAEKLDGYDDRPGKDDAE